jgi:GT2 family glycosyltransferase
VFDRAGFFDERYFFGFEDIDLCLRTRDSGLAVRLAAGAVAYHEGGRSIGAASPRRLYFAARNHLLLAARHRGRDGWVTHARRTIWIVALNIAHALTASGGSVWSRLRATAEGIADYARGRVGADTAA